MTENAILDKTLIIHVPENQQTVTLHLELEAKCTCGSRPNLRPGAYTDTDTVQLVPTSLLGPLESGTGGIKAGTGLRPHQI